ncbi:hypothetical protein LTR16_002042 [Cryomyces antarcticus]|uniref:Uncharacterized protein n=1 Tax=Cryomyces antarcticus TaxID=329879 RepID=A0ABR0M0J6_9PEZI|nr:hypothetical protein LTR60_003225 [Cryomyces antarcticus]KAK5017390.1 hypothetical protein LTR39_001568 [Cryomyces antarcticus]KAK5256930.1 hypothetical protein LTR16_002042 [Cryomyces antarcticus]
MRPRELSTYGGAFRVAISSGLSYWNEMRKIFSSFIWLQKSLRDLATADPDCRYHPVDTYIAEDGFTEGKQPEPSSTSSTTLRLFQCLGNPQNFLCVIYGFVAEHVPRQSEAGTASLPLASTVVE